MDERFDLVGLFRKKGPETPAAQFEQNKKILIDLAQKARDTAKNEQTQYRGFYVGCAMLTADGGIFVGANEKKAKTEPKHCAEREAFESVAASGHDSPVIAVVVVSEESDTNPDNPNHAEHTLEPCDSCKSMFRTESVFTPHTILLMVNDNAKHDQRLESQTTLESFNAAAA